MADIIDIATRRSNAKAEPCGSLTCTFDTAPGVVTLTFVTPEGAFEFGVSPESAELLAIRLNLAALRARFAEAKGKSDD